MSVFIQLKKKNSTLKGVLFSSVAMAFSGLGDALLYPVLPVYGEKMGFSVIWIGVFLSINRFIRIPGNTLIAYLISKKGYKKAILLATILAMLTTAVYGFKMGMFLFLILRIVWGLSYSSLRISSLAYASEAINNKNLMFGLVQSIKTLGAILALFVGAMLIKAYSIKISFLVLGSFSFFAILVAYQLPEIKKKEAIFSFNKTTFFSTINSLTFLTSLSIDGILVVTISKLVSNYGIEELIVVVSGYLLFRKVCSSLVSVLSGWLSDIWNVYLIFRIALLFVLLSLFCIAIGYIELGIVLAFLFNSVLVAMLPAIALKETKNNQLETLTSITTWWDVGAAVGTLTGLLLIEILGANKLYFILFGILLIPVFIFFKKSASFSKSTHP